MKKKYFLVLWTLFLFTGYFLYFSPLSLYHLNQKTYVIEELKEKNLLLQNHNTSFNTVKFDIEKKNYFNDMGYFENNQLVVDIRLPPISTSKNENISKNKVTSNLIENKSLISSIIFFFFLSLFIIIFFIFYYRKKDYASFSHLKLLK